MGLGPGATAAKPARFGKLLRRHRLAAGLSQEALAERAGLSPRGLSDLERGVRSAPRAETIGLLAEALGLSPADRTELAAAARPDAASSPESPLPPAVAATGDRELPRGTVTFLFTDVEGSTARWERDPAAMRAAVERHLSLVREAVEAHGGVLYNAAGDAAQAAFPGAAAAVAAALDAQRALLAEDWGPAGPLRVRMALHAGEAEPGRGGYLAPALNRLGRLLAAGHGGQVLLSAAAADLVRDQVPGGAALRDLGEHRLRDLPGPERIFQLVHPALPAQFPPLRAPAV